MLILTGSWLDKLTTSWIKKKLLFWENQCNMIVVTEWYIFVWYIIVNKVVNIGISRLKVNNFWASTTCKQTHCCCNQEKWKVKGNISYKPCAIPNFIYQMQSHSIIYFNLMKITNLNEKKWEKGKCVFKY